jgi:hypothetical protein
LPYTLRWSFLWLPGSLSLALGLIAILLLKQSQSRYGLCDKEDVIFGWQFLPTLVAVLYTQLTVLLFEDVKRTEPFARLADSKVRDKRKGVCARLTILQASKSWWAILKDIFSFRKRGGQNSWIMIFSGLANAVSVLAVSPLSSLLLSVEDIAISRRSSFIRKIPTTSGMNFTADRDTYFRTTDNIFQNTTTSPWISDDYVILPFWPAETAHAPWDSQLASTPQTWQAETTVFQNLFECEALNVNHKYLRKINDSKYDAFSREYVGSVEMRSTTGCEYNLSLDNSFSLLDEGFTSWSSINHLAYKSLFYDEMVSRVTDPFRGTTSIFDISRAPLHSNNCPGDEILLFSPSWASEEPHKYEFPSNFSISGYVCSSKYHMATMPVTARISTLASQMTFDNRAFQTAKKELNGSEFDLLELQELCTTPQWWSYVPILAADNPHARDANRFGGISSLLAVLYGFDIEAMIDDTNVTERAARIRKRSFAEIIRTSLTEPNDTQEETISGETIVVVNRIVVNPQVAIAMSVLFLVSSIWLGMVAWLSRLCRRPLNLKHDPSTMLGIASLVTREASVLSPFRYFDQATAKEIRLYFKTYHYETYSGVLQVTDDDAAPFLGKKAGHTTLHALMLTCVALGLIFAALGPMSRKEPVRWRPTLFRLRYSTLLVLSILSLIIATLLLKRFAGGSGLHQAIFVYETDVNVIGKRLGRIAPFSIVPTTLAIGIGLWFNTLDKSLRLLQPFVGMSRTPTASSHGAALSYLSTFWIWTTWKSTVYRHWLLVFVSLANFLSQIRESILR